MNITKNLLKWLFVGLVLLFNVMLVIQSIDNVLATNIYIILHLILMSGVLIALIWVDFKEIRKQVREKSQKMDEDFEKERAEKEEKFSRESQAFWSSGKPRSMPISAENKARAAVVVKKLIANLEGNKGLIVDVGSVSIKKVQATSSSFFHEESPVYGPPPKAGFPVPSSERSDDLYGPIKRI